MMKKLAGLTMTLVLALSLGSTPAMAADADAAMTDASLLYAFEGKNVKVKAVPGKNGTFTVTMPLRGPKQLVTWFTDRPIRGAGHLPMDQFVSLWAKDGTDTFKTDPPNVALSFGNKVAVATMTDPTLITNKDGSTSLVSTMKLVKGKVLTTLTAEDGRLSGITESLQGAALPKTATLPSLSVFVDSWPCCQVY